MIRMHLYILFIYFILFLLILECLNDNLKNNYLYIYIYTYISLHDKESEVRKTTMMVLTHLILNDMMKIRGEISEIALLLEDPDNKI